MHPRCLRPFLTKLLERRLDLGAGTSLNIGIVLSKNKRSFIADIEALRLRVSREADQRKASSIALVGLWPECGTSTMSVWLGRSLAEEGQDTLLVDANTAHPGLHDLWSLSTSPGACELVAGTGSEDDAVRGLDIEGLKLLPFGTPSNAGKSPSTESWRGMLETLSSKHEFILVDGGSTESSNALEVAAACDMTVAIALAGTVRREAIKARLAMLTDHGASVLGLVLNQRNYSIPEFVYNRL